MEPTIRQEKSGASMCRKRDESASDFLVPRLSSKANAFDQKFSHTAM